MRTPLVRFKPLACWLTAGALLAVASTLAAAGPSRAAGSTKQYTASFEPECVLAPGILNKRHKVKVSTTAVGPASVSPGEQITFAEASSTITTPEEWANTLVNSFGASEVRGFVTSFVLAGRGGEPSEYNIAKPPAFPEGLPIKAHAEAGHETMLTVPSEGRKFSFGPVKITGNVGENATVEVSTKPGFREIAAGRYEATGEGIESEISGYNEKEEAVITGLKVACTAPEVEGHRLILGEAPIVSPTPPPVWDRNGNVTATGSHIPVLGDGTLELVNAELGELECVTLTFGAVWNEHEGGEAAKPIRGYDEVLSWTADGHAPTSEHTELGSRCRSSKGLHAFLTSEEPLQKVVQEAIVCAKPEKHLSECEETEKRTMTRALRRGPLSTPWKAELAAGEAVHLCWCGECEPFRSGTCPASSAGGETPWTVTVIDPEDGLEAVFRGGEDPKLVNGTRNGLSPSEMEFEGESSGKLASEHLGPATLSGRIKLLGFEGQELMTAGG